MSNSLFQVFCFSVPHRFIVHTSERIIFIFHVHASAHIIALQRKILNHFRFVYGHFLSNLYKFDFSFLSHIPVFLLFARLL